MNICDILCKEVFYVNIYGHGDGMDCFGYVSQI
jgi:hypothetical protein